MKLSFVYVYIRWMENFGEIIQGIGGMRKVCEVGGEGGCWRVERGRVFHYLVLGFV